MCMESIVTTQHSWSHWLAPDLESVLPCSVSTSKQDVVGSAHLQGPANTLLPTAHEGVKIMPHRGYVNI